MDTTLGTCIGAMASVTHHLTCWMIALTAFILQSIGIMFLTIWMIALTAFILQSIGTMFQFTIELELWDLVWIIPRAFAVFVLFRHRSFVAGLLSSFWQELGKDVEAFIQRHFPASQKFELPPNTALVSSDDVDLLNSFANIIQRRINYLEDEKANRQGTEDFLNHQNNARADAEETIEQLRAQLEQQRSDSAAQLEQQRSEQADPQQVARLQEELEQLQVDYDTLEKGHDNWKEAFETLEPRAEQLRNDHAHSERRIEALETQVEVEKTSRQEAQDLVHNFRQRIKILEGEAQEAKDASDPLYDVSDRGDDREENRGEEQVATSTLNGAAPEFVPHGLSHEETVPQGSLNGAAPEFVPHAPSHEETVPQGSLNEDFELPDATAGLDFLQSLKLDTDFGAEPAPAPRAAGPGQARNAHVQKLNAEVMRQTWRKESGMPLSVDEEEGVAGPDDIIDDMYDRQVTQALRALKDAPGDVPGSTETSTPAAPKEEEDPQASFGLADIEDGGKDDESEPTTSRPSLPVTRSCLPSSYWANPEEAAEKTLNEKIGDAIGDALADLARKKGLKSLSDSKWADKLEASSSKKPSRKAPAPSRNPRSPNTAASSSFQRLQERLARDAANK